MNFKVRKDFDVVTAFKDYVIPLVGLEASFNNAGVPVEFILTFWDGKNSVRKGMAVVIDYHSSHGAAISIEGDSPAQAVKRVADAVEIEERRG